MTIKASAQLDTFKPDEETDGYAEYPNQEELKEEELKEEELKEDEQEPEKQEGSVRCATPCTQTVFQMFDPIEPCVLRRPFNGDDEIRRIFEDIELFNPTREVSNGQDEWFRL